MAYAINSYVTSVNLVVSENKFSISWRYLVPGGNTDEESYDLRFDNWPVNLPVPLQNLQAAHVAEYGIRNQAGTRIELKIGDLDAQVDLSLAEYEKRGGLNILDPQGYTKWLAKQHIQGQFAQHGSLLTGRGITMEASIEVQRKLVSGGLVSLGDWITQAGGEDRAARAGITDRDVLHFFLRIEVPDFLAVVAATAHTTYAPLVGLITLLNGNKAAGASITGTGTDPFGNPMVHRYRVRNHQNTELFQIAPMQTFHGLPGGGRLGWLSIHFVVVNAPGTMTVSAQISAIHNWVQRVITAPSDQGVYEDNHIGNREGLLEGTSLNLSDHVRIDAINGVPRVWVPVDTAHVPVHMGAHRILDHDQLTPVLDDENAETHRVMPPITEQPMVHEIHHHGTAGKLVLPRPDAVCASSGNVHPLAVDNRFGTYEIEDSDGNNVVTLTRNQRANLALVWDAEGHQRIVGEVPQRRLISSRGSGGTLTSRGYWDYSATQWARVVSMDAPTYVDADAITVPTADQSPAGHTWNAANYFLGRDSFTLRKGGSIIIYKNVRFVVVGSGTMPHGLTTMLTFLRGNTIGEQALNVYDEITGAGSIYELTWLWFGELEAGDVVQLPFVMPKASTLNIGSATVRQVYQAVILNQSVVHELGLGLAA